MTDTSNTPHEPITMHLLAEIRQEARAICPPLTEEESAVRRMVPADLIPEIVNDPRYVAAAEAAEAAMARGLETLTRDDLRAQMVADYRLARVDVEVCREVLARQPESEAANG